MARLISPSAPPEPLVLAPRLASLSDLAELASQTGGLLLLSGADNSLAGLEPEDFEPLGLSFDSAANAFSFCVNGRTLTAIEDPDDGYRSTLGALILREGELCKNRFPALPLRPRFYNTYDGDSPALIEGDPMIASRQASLMDLVEDGAEEALLSVGTDYSEDYYPSCVSYFSAELFDAALARFQARELEREALPGSKGSELSGSCRL